MNYTLDREAQRDLEHYVAHVAQSDVIAATSQSDRVDQVLTALAENPRLGRRMRIRGAARTVRAFAITGTPLIAYFIEMDSGIHVLRLFHGAREPIAR